jgi:chromosome partitioning protein
MPATLCIANQKGGVGKTTTATCLAHAFALTGRHVLLVDIDPQANATSGIGLAAVPETPAFAPVGFLEAIVQSPWHGVSAIPAGHDLEIWAAHRAPPLFTLRDHLRTIPEHRFEVVIIDCPPSLGPLTQNALAAATSVIIPIQCEYYPLEGLVHLLAAINQSQTTNPALRVGGVLLTMVDPAAALTAEVETEVRTKLTERVFRTMIPRDIAVAEAPSHCRSVIDYAPRSSGARGYVDLAIEIVEAGLLASSDKEKRHG